MTPEGWGWFYFTYKTILKTYPEGLQIIDWIGPASYQGYVSYQKTFRIDSLFASFPPSANDLWVVISDTNQTAQVYDHAPLAKVLYLFNPWPNNSPQMIFGDKKPVQMHLCPGICGWYIGFYMGPPDSISNVKFMDYFHTQQYTADGLADGPGIDLRPIFGSGDTVYILPIPNPSGAPALTATFPGKTGDCGLRKITGHFRDWQCDSSSPNPSFYNGPIQVVLNGGHKNMVQDTLSAPDYKPKKTTDTNVNVSYLGHLETWYVTQSFPAGSSRATNDTCIDLIFKKGETCGWEFNSDWTNGFFPLDSFVNPNNIQLFISTSKDSGYYHNYYFTMEMHVQFVYRKGFDYKVYAGGDDDAWVFINNRLAIDLGGISPGAEGPSYLDSMETDLGLIDGNKYAMDIFHAERCPTTSNFRIVTSMDIYSPDSVTGVQMQRPLRKCSIKQAGLIIPMRAVSGKYYSINGQKISRKNISHQPLVKVQGSK